MPLVQFLYRCPHCGHDPTVGEKDEAACVECGMTYRRGGPGGLISISDPSGRTWDVPSHILSSSVDRWTEQDLDGPAVPEVPIHSSRVTVRESGDEAPVFFGGELMGFAEAMGSPTSGTLELSSESIALRRDSGPGGPRQCAVHVQQWALLDIRAVQTSSSSLQFSPRSGGLVEFKFPEDSPFRWESLLRGALRRAYRRAGLGEIVEFQPRVVTR
jgi:hypothetical protein